MYSFLDSNIRWDNPSYTKFDKDVKLDEIEKLIRKECSVLWRSVDEINHDKLRKVFDYNYKVGKNYYIYSNDERHPVHVGWENALRYEKGKFKVMKSDKILTGKEEIKLIEIPSKQFNYYRTMWTFKAKMKDAVAFSRIVELAAIKLKEIVDETSN